MQKDIATVHPAAPAGIAARSVRLVVGGRSECGPVRDNNEDRYLVVRLERITTPVATNIGPAELKFMPQQAMWAVAVADGMGGHAAGEVASTLALSLALQFSQQGSRWFTSVGESEAREICDRIETILHTVDQSIAEEAEHHPSWDGMGSTLTALGILGDAMFLCQVGDSRAYVLRGGQLQRLTHDQTMAQQLIDAGVLAPEHAGAHPGRHVLTQALGRGNVTLTVERFQLQHGDRLVLTTDGVTDVLDDDRIAQLATAADPQVACDALIEGALPRTRDNLTVVVADVQLD